MESVGAIHESPAYRICLRMRRLREEIRRYAFGSIFLPVAKSI